MKAFQYHSDSQNKELIDTSTEIGDACRRVGSFDLPKWDKIPNQSALHMHTIPHTNHQV